MADEVLTATVSETGSGAYQVDLAISGYRLTGDEPVSFGGNGTGPSPMDLLVSALAACTTMTIRWYALQQKWPLEHVSVEVTHRKGGEGASSPRQDVFSKTITLNAPELTAEQRAKLVEIAARCPVQRVLEGTPLIHTRAA